LETWQQKSRDDILSEHRSPESEFVLDPWQSQARRAMLSSQWHQIGLRVGRLLRVHPNSGRLCLARDGEDFAKRWSDP
jgi:hypothetical protein